MLSEVRGAFAACAVLCWLAPVGRCEEIGREFGNRHHSTGLHSVNRIEVMRRTDEALNRTISLLMRRTYAMSVSESRYRGAAKGSQSLSWQF